MAKLVDAPDLGSGIERCEGSSPFTRTTFFFTQNINLQNIGIAARVLSLSTIDARKLIKYEICNWLCVIIIRNQHK